jgi:hypothetical protein
MSTDQADTIPVRADERLEEEKLAKYLDGRLPGATHTCSTMERINMFYEDRHLAR